MSLICHFVLTLLLRLPKTGTPRDPTRGAGTTFGQGVLKILVIIISGGVQTHNSLFHSIFLYFCQNLNYAELAAEELQ